jgi:catechol 2,3-dioxygenase-like lactoylglutathione lyase family enzyme
MQPRHTSKVVIDHLGTTVRDLKWARGFYSAALGALGMRINMDFETAFGFGSGGDNIFWLSGDPNATGGGHFAFRVDYQEEVDAFHAAAMAAGGEDNGAPGPRPNYGPNYYAAFVKDRDGNNLEAVCYAKQAKASPKPKRQAKTKAKAKPKAKAKAKAAPKKAAAKVAAKKPVAKKPAAKKPAKKAPAKPKAEKAAKPAPMDGESKEIDITVHHEHDSDAVTDEHHDVDATSPLADLDDHEADDDAWGSDDASDMDELDDAADDD